MRASSSGNGVTLKAYSGTTGVLLAVDIDEVKAKRQGLLGFAFKRNTLSGDRKGEERWLRGLLRFPHQIKTGTEAITLDSRTAPIQKFRWSDYTVFPGIDYTYTVRPVYGTPQAPDLRAGTEVTIRTMGAGDDEPHIVMFNRAVAASQAFTREFPDEKKRIDDFLKAKKGKPKRKTKPDPLVDEKETETLLSDGALAWLSRGTLDLFKKYIGTATAAGKGAFLDVAIYEYELTAIRDAIFEAAKAGATVRLIYHAKAKDDQTAVNKRLVAHANDLTVLADVKPRVTNAIMHDKYIVRGTIDGAGKRTPQAVLCGSTNFTLNGVYRQGNVLHIAHDAGLAGQYEAMFETLLETREDQAATRAAVSEKNPIALSANKTVFAGFSPRSGGADLDTFVGIINGAGRDVLFCTAFVLPQAILDALLGKAQDPILRYGVQNTRSTITGTHADRTAQFDATAFLTEGLEGWQRESTYGQKGNILIHTKMVVVDFTSDTPTVISGSHNLSNNASASNDENFLVIHGLRDVADAYGCELMRFYDHYRFRWLHEHPENKVDDEPPSLKDTDIWTKDYFVKDTLKFRDRIRFAGGDPDAKAGPWPPMVVPGSSKKAKPAAKKKAAKKKVAAKAAKKKAAKKKAGPKAAKKKAAKKKAAKKKVAKKKVAKKKAAKKKTAKKKAAAKKKL